MLKSVSGRVHQTLKSLIMGSIRGGRQPRAKRLGSRFSWQSVGEASRQVERFELRTMLSGLYIGNSQHFGNSAIVQYWSIDAADAPTVPAGGGSGGGGLQLGGNGLQFNLIAAGGMPQNAIDGFTALVFWGLPVQRPSPFITTISAPVLLQMRRRSTMRRRRQICLRDRHYRFIPATPPRVRRATLSLTTTALPIIRY